MPLRRENLIKEFVRGRSCAVLGLGVSNIPLVDMLCDIGVCVTVYDKKSADELGTDASRFASRGVRFVCDGNFENIEEQIIFRSPGIRPDKKGIERAIDSGAELTSEMELFLKLVPARTFGITGSDGKTTTTTLTGKFLGAADGGKTYVGGNIGEPLLDKCEDMSASDNAVLELSSFQLMNLCDSPEYVAITNVSPNHLDWHTDMSEYVRAKKNIIGERTKRVVTNADCYETFRLACEVMEWDDVELILFSSSKVGYEQIFGNLTPACPAKAIYLSDGYICVGDREGERRLLSLEDIKIPGMHNVENYMTAIGLTLDLVPAEIYGEVAREFFGVEHRLEFVRRIDGVDYYNSSIDSSPTRSAAALSAMKDKSLVLICGGYDKNLPYEPLARAICEHGGVRGVSLTGATGGKIRAEIEKYQAKNGVGENIKVEYNRDFKTAVSTARAMADEGDCVLLTPASASFDAFKNFMERGNTFKKLVEEF